MLRLARTLGIAVIAEGVETAEQMQVLRREQCDAVEGFLLGLPRPIETYDALTGRVARLRA